MTIDGGRYAHLADRVPRDAVAVNETMVTLFRRDPTTRALVARAARRAEQPEPSFASPLPWPTRCESRADQVYVSDALRAAGWRRGDPKILILDWLRDRTPLYATVVDRVGGRRVKRTIERGYQLGPRGPVYASPIDWQPHPSFVDWLNDECRRFAAALERLAAALAGDVLQDHAVAGLGLAFDPAAIPPRLWPARGECHSRPMTVEIGDAAADSAWSDDGKPLARTRHARAATRKP
ncbi:MAG TPA: hypothetical protein VKS60_22015 [Stellaceae bacterium]|nr:hypothetical protein [Stellaceae bacterium]